MKKKDSRYYCLYCLGAFSLLAPAPAHATEKDPGKPDRQIACSYAHKNPSASGGAELSIKNHKISRVYFKSYYPGDSGKLSFICDINLSREDAAYAWQDSDLGTTTITIKETGDTVQLSADKKNKGYTLDFAKLNALSKWCGAGAEVPEGVFIPLSGKPCKITMPR